MRFAADARAYLPSNLVSHGRNGSRGLASLAVAGIVVLLSGCAVQYYDPDTGTTHVWGFGHLSMKVPPPNDGLQAVVRATRVVGLSLGRIRERTYLTLGYDSEQQSEILSDSAAVYLEWPAGDLFNLRIGSSWPAASWSGPVSNQQYRNKETPEGIGDE